MSEKITTDSGLVMTTLTEGTGDTPSTGDKVLIHYEIWVGEGVTTSEYNSETNTYNDSIHDSTYDERNPFHGPIEVVIGRPTPDDDIYTMGDSIQGIDEALVTMKEGGKKELFIPAALAYGDLGASSFHTFHGYRTPPNTPLKCHIELVEIKK